MGVIRLSVCVVVGGGKHTATGRCSLFGDRARQLRCNNLKSLYHSIDCNASNLQLHPDKSAQEPHSKYRKRDGTRDK